jgi:hypothetical protein
VALDGLLVPPPAQALVVELMATPQRTSDGFGMGTGFQDAPFHRRTSAPPEEHICDQRPMQWMRNWLLRR